MKPALEVEMTEPAAGAVEHWWGRSEPDVVAREVVAPGAIADLVGCRLDSRRAAERSRLGYPPILEWAPLACLAVCRAPMTTVDLAAMTGLSVSGARKAAAAAVAAGALRREGQLLSRNPSWASAARRLVALELKLNDWRKALRQATVYRDWADEAWVVMGHAISPDLLAGAERVGVGVALLDGESFRVIMRPAKAKHERFAVGRLLAGEQAFAQAVEQGRATRATPTARGAWLPAVVC